MSDHDHVQACYEARLNGLKQFFMARGHGAGEADDLAKRHLRGETVHINPPSDTPNADSLDRIDGILAEPKGNSEQARNHS